MTNRDRIVVGAEFYDSQVSANVTVVDVAANHHYPKCKVDHSGAIYYARADALTDRKS